MADLAMADAARGFAVNDQADADAGADRDIGEVVQALRAAPAHLRQRGAVDIRVEPDRSIDGGGDRPDDIGVAPAGLVGSEDMPVAGIGAIKADRPERRDPDRSEAMRRIPVAQRRQDRRERLGRQRGRNGSLIDDLAGTVRQRTDAFGAAELDARKWVAMLRIWTQASCPLTCRLYSIPVVCFALVR